MNKSVIAALILVAVLALWMLSGLFASDNDAAEAIANTNGDSSGAPASGDPEQPLMKVEVARISASEITREVTLQGQVEPLRRLRVVAQTSGLVEELPIDKGQIVKLGDLLVKLSLDARGADLAEANAMVQAARAEQRAASKLQKQGLQSELALDQANANLAGATARRDRIALEITHTEIRAPFDGILNDLSVEQGQLIERGNPVADIIDNTGFKISATAGQQVISQIKKAQPVVARLITGEELEGTISYLSSVADATTRSFAVEAVVTSDGQALAAGVSASLVVPVESINATLVSPSSMALGQAGEIGVKTIDDDNKVEFHSVDIVSSSNEGAWVTGVPDNSRIIMLGQGFVNSGDEVEPVETKSLQN